MSLSSALSILFALAACVVFHLGGADRTAMDQQAYVSVAVGAFSCAAIVSLFVVLFIGRSRSDQDFGKLIRGEIGTIQGALLISLVYTGYNLVRSFGL